MALCNEEERIRYEKEGNPPVSFSARLAARILNSFPCPIGRTAREVCCFFLLELFEKKPPYVFPPNERRSYKFCILRLAGTSSMASSWSQMIVGYIHDTVADCRESLWVLHDILSLRIQIWRSRVRRFAAGSVDIFLQQKTIVEFRDDSSKGKQKC